VNRAKFAIVALPALLTSTGVLAADLGKTAEVASGPGYTLSASMGVIAFGLPATDTGVLANGNFTTTDPDSNPVGLEGSLSGQFDIGTTGGAKLSIGVDVFGALAGGSHSTTETYTGSGFVQIPGYTLPAGGTINLGAGAGSAHYTIGGLGVDQTASVNGGGLQDAIGVVEAPNAFSLGLASATAGNTGAAYGAIGSTTGGMFVAGGNLTGLKIRRRPASRFSTAARTLIWPRVATSAPTLPCRPPSGPATSI